MVEKQAVVANSAGIHVRPAGVIFGAVKGYPGHIRISANGAETGMESVMGLIALGLQPGETVEIRVDGPEEAETAERLVQLFETPFDFPSRDR